MFDPYRLPLPDLGLKCLDCGYPLAHLTEWRCPECGKAIDLDEHVPDGAFPMLIANGREVRASAEVRELFAAYRLPLVELWDTMRNFLGVVTDTRRHDGPGPPIAVPRERYLEAVDLIRRWHMDEELPPPPEPAPIDGPWDCSACGEENPETFEVCWNCETPWDNGA